MAYLLNNPLFGGGEVISRSINERESEVKHQVDDKGSNALCQKHL